MCIREREIDERCRDQAAVLTALRLLTAEGVTEFTGNRIIPHQAVLIYRLRDRSEALQRGLTSAQLSQLLFAELFGAACHCPHSVLDEYPAELRIGRRGGDVTESSQQPQADRHVRLRIHADLLKGRLQQALEVNPSNAGADDARGIVEQILRRLSGREADQNAAQLIDAVDGGGGVVDGGRDRLQGNIDNLQDAKLHVLLQRSGRAAIEGGKQIGGSFGGQTVPL